MTVALSFSRKRKKIDKRQFSFDHIIPWCGLNLHLDLNQMTYLFSNRTDMKSLFITTIFFLVALFSQAQELYFPPTTGSTWETVSPEELGWCENELPALYTYLDDSDTKAFLILKDGKIVVEWYFGTFTQDSAWYWASAGKSLTAFLVGLAQEQGYLSIDEPSSQYLGNGWTSLSAEQESAITIRNQLTMTSGLNDGLDDPYCTDPECLQYLAAPDSRWAYHNAPYTLLDGVLQQATGSSPSQLVFSNLTSSTGITGLFLPSGYNNVFFSKARSMARFGLLMLNNGNWDGNQIMNDQSFLYDMIHPSQNLNQSYGYLWWLNGQDSFMYPQSQITFPGMLMPSAPADLYAAEGKNAQFVNIVPSENLIVVRMGNDPVNTLVSVTYNNEIWDYLNLVRCGGEFVDEAEVIVEFFPNPSHDCLYLKNGILQELNVFNSLGKKEQVDFSESRIMVEHLSSGIYHLNGRTTRGHFHYTFIKD